MDLVSHEVTCGADEICAPTAAFQLPLHAYAASNLKQQEDGISHKIHFELGWLPPVKLQHDTHLAARARGVAGTQDV